MLLAPLAASRDMVDYTSTAELAGRVVAVLGGSDRHNAVSLAVTSRGVVDERRHRPV